MAAAPSPWVKSTRPFSTRCTLLPSASAACDAGEATFATVLRATMRRLRASRSARASLPPLPGLAHTLRATFPIVI